MTPFPGALDYLKVFRRRIGRRMYVIFVLAAVGAITEGIGISLLLPLLGTMDLHGGVDEGTPAALRWLTDTLGISNSLNGILLLIGIAFSVKGLVQFGEAAFAGHLQAQMIHRLKTRIFEAYGRMQYSYYTTRNTGYFINVINGQVANFFASFTAFRGFLTGVIQAVSYLGVAIWLAWQFGLMALLVGGLVLLVFRGLNSRVRDISRLSAAESGTLHKQLLQVLQGFKYLTATNQLGRLKGGVLDSIERITQYRRRMSLWGAITTSISEPLSVFFIIGIIIIQVELLGQPIAPILVAILLFHRGLQAMIGVQGRWQTTMNSIGSVEMVEDEIANLEKHREPNGTRKIGPLSRAITLRNVSFYYSPDSGEVLSDVSLDIPVRHTVAFVGESGAGKSTLLDLLTLMLRPTSGELSVDGVPGTEIDLRSWRSQIGFVSQETVVFDDTVAANIAMREVDSDRDPDLFERVRAAARKAHIAHFVEDLPEGYDTVVGDRGVRLSGGQRQRLFIARELFKEPNLLILDEATSALDSESERHIQESIDSVKGSMTVVIIAHRLATIKNADLIYVMDSGRVLESGSYADLTGRSMSRFREMVELQTL